MVRRKMLVKPYFNLAKVSEVLSFRLENVKKATVKWTTMPNIGHIY